MSQRFFKLADDVYVPHRWHLATPIDGHGRKVHDRDFTRGTPVHVEGRLRVPIKIEGRPLDFSEAGLSIPVVHVKVASMLLERASSDVQFIPADIEGQPAPASASMRRTTSCSTIDSSTVEWRATTAVASIADYLPGL